MSAEYSFSELRGGHAVFAGVPVVAIGAIVDVVVDRLTDLLDGLFVLRVDLHASWIVHREGCGVLGLWFSLDSEAAVNHDGDDAGGVHGLCGYSLCVEGFITKPDNRLVN